MTGKDRPTVRSAWAAFENRAFGLMIKVERRVRGLPANVRLQPNALDRRVFRLFVGTLAVLTVVLAMLTRRLRIRALLIVGAVMFVLLFVFLLLDAFPRRKR